MKKVIEGGSVAPLLVKIKELLKKKGIQLSHVSEDLSVSIAFLRNSSIS